MPCRGAECSCFLRERNAAAPGTRCDSVSPDLEVPLSVLDLVGVVAGQSSADALRGSTTTAQAADRLGFRRLWVAEHHNMGAVASTTPPVLIAHLAAHTERIKVGSGGVMLPNHAPLVVAEQFAMLEALHPGRIDLGLGRAPGSDQRTAAALRRAVNAGAEVEFAHEIQLVESYLGSRIDSGAAIVATPAPVSVPEIWVLGSSLSSAVVAAALGLPYAFAHHFSGENTGAALALYRERFEASPSLDHPHVMVTVEALAAEDDATAERLSLPSMLSFIDLRRGLRRPGRTAEESAAHEWTPDELAFVQDRQRNAAIGSRETARAALAALQQRFAADEMMIVVRANGLEERLRTLELLAPAERTVRSR